ncbi:hypothetical protein ABK040_015399 [Willaertia magna]
MDESGCLSIINPETGRVLSIGPEGRNYIYIYYSTLSFNFNDNLLYFAAQQYDGKFVLVRLGLDGQESGKPIPFSLSTDPDETGFTIIIKGLFFSNNGQDIYIYGEKNKRDRNSNQLIKELVVVSVNIRGNGDYNVIVNYGSIINELMYIVGLNSGENYLFADITFKLSNIQNQTTLFVTNLDSGDTSNIIVKNPGLYISNVVYEPKLNKFIGIERNNTNTLNLVSLSPINSNKAIMTTLSSNSSGGLQLISKVTIDSDSNLVFLCLRENEGDFVYTVDYKMGKIVNKVGLKRQILQGNGVFALTVNPNY